MPHGSPRYVPSCELDEWLASVSVSRTSPTVTVPPLLSGVRHAVVRDALRREPAAQLDLRDDGAAEALVQRDRVADVVVVPVRDGDQIDALGLALALGAARVAVQPGVDVEPVPPGVSSRKAACPSQVI